MLQNSLTDTIKESLEKSLSYTEYNNLVERLVEEHKTSGPKQHEDLVYFTKLNAHRVKRLNKTIELTPDIEQLAKAVDSPQTWLVLSESWCGDAAQTLPLIHKVAEANALITLRIVFRDEHLPLMDEFLTNGGRSIPKLLILNSELEVQGTWGPRPEQAQALYNSWKNDPNKPPYREFQVEMQKWYLADKGVSTFQEISAVLKAIKRVQTVSS
ncbi:MAG: thioredoxin family protein [Bacteroidota bacterium]